MTPVVLEGMGFEYPGTDHPVFEDLHLSISSGEITWLYGALGAGASTLLQIVAGLTPRHTGGTLRGRVSVLGVEPESLMGRLGYVTATPGIQLSQVAETVWQEVAFAPANLGWPRARIERGANDALAALGIAHLAQRRPETLSGGELQRVVLASMMVLEPQLWLLDEPTSALDAAGREVVHRLMGQWTANGAAVLLASEDADSLATLADRVVVLERGRIVLDGAPREILSREPEWEAAGGTTAIADIARAAAASAGDSLGPPYPLDVAGVLQRCPT